MSRERIRTHQARRRFTSLLCERLEDRQLLAAVGYQVHLLPVDGSIAGPELTTINVGQAYDLAVSVRDVRENPGANAGVYAGYLDIGYDSSKTRVQVAEIQKITIGPFTAQDPASAVTGSFRLSWNGHVTGPIAMHASPVTVASRLQEAISGLSGVGVGNVAVSVDVLSKSSEFVFQVRFVGSMSERNVANLAVAAQGLLSPSNPVVSVSHEGDLVSGASSYAFREAFRSRIADAKYPNGVSAKDLPNLLDDVGAFAGSTPTGAAALELVRARMVATSTGTVTFTPDVQNLARGFETLLLSPASSVPPAQIDLGSPRTLTIGTAPILAQPDSFSVFSNTAAYGVAFDVLANDMAFPTAGKTIVSVTEPTYGSARIANNQTYYVPPPEFNGIATFSYTAGANSQTATTTVTVAVSSPVHVMQYQVRIVPPNGSLFARDAVDPVWLAATPDLTTLNVGEEFDLVITVAAGSRTPNGVYAAWVDLGYDDAKVSVQAPHGVREAFRPQGISSIAGISDATVFFPNAFSAAAAPNLIDNVGGYAATQLPFTGILTPAETAAGIHAAPPRELARARFKATAAGSIPFSLSLENVPVPAYETLVNGLKDKMPLSSIDLGTAKSLTVTSGRPPITAAADAAVVAEDSGPNLIDVLSNDTTAPAGGQVKNVVSVTQPLHGTVTFTASGVAYTPAANYVGTDVFTYAARNITAGAASDLSSATVTVTVTPVNDAPAFVAGADQQTTDESGAVSILGWASQIVAGPADETGQSLEFFVSVDQPSLFTVQPQLDAAGTLTYTAAPNANGAAQVSVRLKDGGGRASGGVDESQVQNFVIQVVKLRPHYNAAMPLDASGDSYISAGDALECINHINAFGAGPVGDRGLFLDTTGDGFITAADPLAVINHINAFGPTKTPPGGGEGETAAGANGSRDDDLTATIDLLALDLADLDPGRRRI